MSKPQIKIIRFRALTEHDLQFMRLLKPFEDHHDVTVFDHTDTNQDLSLVVDICHDPMSPNQHNFNHILQNVTNEQLPSDVFKHLYELDEHWPTLCWYFERDDGQRMNFRRVKNHYELQVLLKMADDRNHLGHHLKLNN